MTDPETLIMAVPVLTFVLVFGFFGWIGTKLYREWRHNENSPRLTSPARVTEMRTEKRPRRKANYHLGDGFFYTVYHVTFETIGGERIPAVLTCEEYESLFEGARGMLTYQGTRYIGFSRKA